MGKCANGNRRKRMQKEIRTQTVRQVKSSNKDLGFVTIN